MMKFSCEKALLQSAIAITSRAVAQKSSIPALEGLLLHADHYLTISGYNMQTGIRTRVSADVTDGGDIVLNARLFGDIIRRMPDDVVTFTADDKQMVHLNCGDADFDILGLSAADYPDLPEVEDEFSVSIQQKRLRAMIEETAFAISTNESRPIHTGSLFEVDQTGLTLVSVDGYRLALRREAVERTEGAKSFSFVVPGSALSEVEKICSGEGPVTVNQGARHVLFQTGDTVLVCRRLEGEFLAYRNAIPRNNPIHVECDARTLLASIDRVSLIISEKLKSPLRCVFGDGLVSITTKTGIGDAADQCPITGDGQELEIGFNNKYLMDALKAAPADRLRLEFSSGVAPCVILPAEGEENFIYMVLPVRLKAN